MRITTMKIVYGAVAALLIAWAALSSWAEFEHRQLTECIWHSPANEWDDCIESRPRLAVQVREINDAIFE